MSDSDRQPIDYKSIALPLRQSSLSGYGVYVEVCSSFHSLCTKSPPLYPPFFRTVHNIYIMSAAGYWSKWWILPSRPLVPKTSALLLSYTSIKYEFYSSYQRKTRKNVTVLRLTEVTVLMSNDSCAPSNSAFSSSSPPYEGICGIMAANAGATPTQIGSKPTTLLLC